jgi:hypothetical protein
MQMRSGQHTIEYLLFIAAVTILLFICLAPHGGGDTSLLEQQTHRTLVEAQSAVVNVISNTQVN